MITRELRRVVGRALAGAGLPAGADPGLRPTGAPGRYAASVALALGASPRATAAALAGTLAREQWIAAAEVTGPGYLTITVTPEALTAVAADVIAAGPGCVTSDALAGTTVTAPPPGDPLAAATWEEARTALAARLTSRLAAAAGATVRHQTGQDQGSSERVRPALPADTSSPDPAGPLAGASPAGEGTRRGADPRPGESGVAAAVAFAGRDAVAFTLARAIPGRPLAIDGEIMARRVPGNPAYAVRYAHARAAAGVRWAAASPAVGTIGSGETPRSPLGGPCSGLAGPRPELFVPAAGADMMAVCAIGPGHRNSGGALPREITALLDALSWLPERVATAARRGRPDEFARYLEDLASVTVDVLTASHPAGAAAPGNDRLGLAMAARTGLAAGLGLLDVTAPERL